MQINSAPNATAAYGTNQAGPQPQPEKLAKDPNSSKSEGALTVAISPEAQAMQKAADARKTEGAQRADNERAMLQQQVQNMPSAAKSQRIDIAV